MFHSTDSVGSGDRSVTVTRLHVSLVIQDMASRLSLNANNLPSLLQPQSSLYKSSFSKMSDPPSYDQHLLDRLNALRKSSVEFDPSK